MGQSKLRQEKLQPCSLPYPPRSLLGNWNWGEVSVSSQALHRTDQTSQQIALRSRLTDLDAYPAAGTHRRWQARWVEGKALCYKTKRRGQKHCTASSGVSDTPRNRWPCQHGCPWERLGGGTTASASRVTDSGVTGVPREHAADAAFNIRVAHRESGKCSGLHVTHV